MLFLYLIATLFFVFGVKRLTSVKTCAAGNRMSEIGMAVAVIATLIIFRDSVNWVTILAGAVIGGGVGLFLAKRTPTTQMPELVAALNGFGGLSSAMVAMAEVIKISAAQTEMAERMPMIDVPTISNSLVGAIAVVAAILIGMVTLTGSFVAYAKLSGKQINHPLQGSSRHALHLILGVAAIGFGAWMCSATGASVVVGMLMLAIVAAVLGVLLVMPIGGADMPVVVSLLNSYSGIAAAFAGFVIHAGGQQGGGSLLVVVGSLVGASGLILTQIMCKAMNRSLGNVLLGGMGGEDEVAEDARDYNNIKQAGPEEVGMLLDGASSVIVVPGYGLAVAQAQHVVRELGDLLIDRGVEVRYAIHPVAGRMPGHMNVLLAESDVPYDQLWEMERIN
ncbi:MAG: NAD(P)(+) transhydrogenase (Re/Si-specific) subunit beta, partial [Planctomycetota bacterium]|nr:NAD(P)(+) transhydrogenase (Re/Si-specific) subunit beta [Planctomycetota bacterium]